MYDDVESFLGYGSGRRISTTQTPAAEKAISCTRGIGHGIASAVPPCFHANVKTSNTNKQPSGFPGGCFSMLLATQHRKQLIDNLLLLDLIKSTNFVLHRMNQSFSVDVLFLHAQPSSGKGMHGKGMIFLLSDIFFQSFFCKERRNLSN